MKDSSPAKKSKRVVLTPKQRKQLASLKMDKKDTDTKTAMLGAGTIIGSLLGGATGGKGRRLEGAGRGAVRGAGVDIGTTVGSGVGAIAGGGLGAGGGAILAGALTLLSKSPNAERLLSNMGGGALLGGVMGATGGALTGLPVGGVLGYQAAGKVMPPASPRNSAKPVADDSKDDTKTKESIARVAEHMILSKVANIYAGACRLRN